MSKAYSNGNYDRKKDKIGNLNRIIVVNNIEINDNTFLNSSNKMNDEMSDNNNNNEETYSSDENENRKAVNNKSIDILKNGVENVNNSQKESNLRALSV